VPPRGGVSGCLQTAAAAIAAAGDERAAVGGTLLLLLCEQMLQELLAGPIRIPLCSAAWSYFQVSLQVHSSSAESANAGGR
jgi:hypothetical protein